MIVMHETCVSIKEKQICFLKVMVFGKTKCIKYFYLRNPFWRRGKLQNVKSQIQNPLFACSQFHLYLLAVSFYLLDKAICKIMLSLKCMTQKIISAYLKGLSKYRRNDIFLFEISFFVLELVTFFYYANQISDDVIILQLKSGKN